MEVLILTKERISKLVSYYSCQLTDEELTNSVKVRYNPNQFIVWLVDVDFDFKDFKENYTYFGDLKNCLKDVITQSLKKNRPCKITLNFFMDYFDVNMDFLGREHKKKMEISIDI
jgi:hypothetical protein